MVNVQFASETANKAAVNLSKCFPLGLCEL